MASARAKNAKAKREQEQADSEPRIKWHELDIMTSIELAEMEDAAGEVQVLAQALANGIATQEMVERLLELRSPERAKAQIMQRLENLAKYVEFVPRDWFTDAAPDELDFSEPTTYKMLRTARFGELSQMLAFGQKQADTAGKN